MPSICWKCGDPIDLDACQRAIDTNERYDHPCGRILVGRKTL